MEMSEKMMQYFFSCLYSAGAINPYNHQMTSGKAMSSPVNIATCRWVKKGAVNSVLMK
jgi:hypothetical protein